MAIVDRTKDDETDVGTVRSLSIPLRGSKRGAKSKSFEFLAKLLACQCVQVTDAERNLRSGRVNCYSFSDNEAAILVASLIFLMTRAFSTGPVPGDPAEVASLNPQNQEICSQKMPVFQRACVEK